MTTLQEISKVKKAALQENFYEGKTSGTRVVVGMATCGQAAGATKVLKVLQEKANGASDIIIKMTGCIGHMQA